MCRAHFSTARRKYLSRILHSKENLFLFSQSRNQREGIDNHTCNVLEQISNLLLSVNTDLSSNWEKIENSIYWEKYFAKTVEDGWMCWLFGTFLLQNQLRPLRDWRFLFSRQLFRGKVFVHFFKLQAMLPHDILRMRPAKDKFCLLS